MTPMAGKTLPLVSICTPTKDRLRFLTLLLRCIQQQTYPLTRIEWVVVDDGVESAESLCGQFMNTRYVRLDPAAGSVPLGRKRNLCHASASGDILINMDDDDYYPPRRVAHAVETLLANPSRLIAGANLLPIYFPDRNAIFLFGPYRKNHATAGSFAFRRELLQETSYEDAAKCSEELYFLKNYTIPMAQLESTQTILAMSHDRNTFDKRPLLANPHQPQVRRTKWTLANRIADPELRAGYLAAIADVGGNEA
jgi:glycosyltransferase involved in cell wall biosynthesis